jgi:3-hydroxybutyryl-CoA dehydratase
MTVVLEQDFDALERGQRFSTRGRTVTEADVVGFATLTGDMHPQHVDGDWSAHSRFGERIAHGLLVLSYAAGLVPFDPERVVALRGVRDAVFKAPVKLGDTIHVEGEIAATKELDPGHGLVEVRWRVLNQRGKLVMRAAVEVVWKRGDGASERTASTSAQPVLI